MGGSSGLRRARPLHRGVLLLAFLTLVGPADAQVLYGSIVGTVTDASQAAVPRAAVTVIHQETNLAREATTRRDGSYGFVDAMPGTYTVRVVLAGFREYLKKDVPVSASTVARVDVRLEVGALSEAVTVQSERALLQTDTGDLHTELQSEEITNLPLGGYRNYQALLNLVPGTTTPPPSGMTTSANIDAPSAPLTININGTAHNNNNTRLDGTSDIYIWRPGWTAYTAPAETVDTVSVSTGSFDAEQGMAGGAAIAVMTRSGSNELHGSAFVFHENEDLRARNFFNTPDKGDKIDSSLYMGGVTLGGPIVKDKLFFFGSWEGIYETKSWTQTGSVATEAMRRGDLWARRSTTRPPATPTGPAGFPSPATSSLPSESARSRHRSRRRSPCRTGTAFSATTPTRVRKRWTGTVLTSS
jgi:hypothetical protein